MWRWAALRTAPRASIRRTTKVLLLLLSLLFYWGFLLLFQRTSANVLNIIAVSVAKNRGKNENESNFLPEIFNIIISRTVLKRKLEYK